MTQESLKSIAKSAIEIVTAVGLLTFFQFFAYKIIGKDFIAITVKFFDKDVDIDNLNAKYDILRIIDLDPQNTGQDHKYFLIGPEDKKMTKIKFYQESYTEFDNGLYYSRSKEKIPKNFILYPQQYLLIRSQTRSGIPANLIKFKINYQPGKYYFSLNMRNGKNDKVYLEVKRTLISFLEK
ncbi:hypothetical protein JZO72_08065 [Vagococcus fluvialis]|uniref:hypothetical protein n=1 Tax=Vagococcus TaxID=2737 RepID=UPI001A8DACBF|nr:MULTISPECIES: hypothetical protein [Vagococcus]MBO0479583.1 hypothetical protein [Vagococcus fluvialis]MBO0485337.1 hypothetical protein [Vagococcus fluvialis]MDT2829769.1 hypothetical protein [Vagococcus carniphilus]MDT2839228.1 hypothetical protein [Vagococcus carniphilus]MDT2853286.1 hypothetical protein [Vagococcus carniphilus]